VARIVLGSYVVQFPLGGYLSWVLQWLVGFRDLGHDVFFVESASDESSCYDPIRDEMTSDPAFGIRALDGVLTTFGLRDRWCFRDVAGTYHGADRRRLENEFASADVFVDMGTHGAWTAEAARSACRVLVDGEPAATQMKRAQRLAAGATVPDYDAFFTVGQNIGTPASTAPTAGETWKHVFYPVACGRVPVAPPPVDAPFTTVMSWSAHDQISWNGSTYGAKDLEFEKFIVLPTLTHATVELSVAGRSVPHDRLLAAGFHLRDAHEVSLRLDDFHDYIRGSLGEFSVAKNVFVETRCGWFGDRAAMYLAAGRPVVMQETGFSGHLPTGSGLFAVETAEEAAAAMDEIMRNYAAQSAAARSIAVEYLDTSVVLPRFLAEVGL
jgi:hypothetical protein